MSGSTPRPAEYHVLGVDGPVVVVPGRVAAWLLSRAGLADYHRAHRGDDPEVDQIMVAMKIAAITWRERNTAGTDHGTPAADTPPHAAPSPRWLSTTAVARAMGITTRATVKAISAGRLPAVWSGGRWWIDPDDVEHYRASRGAAGQDRNTPHGRHPAADPSRQDPRCVRNESRGDQVPSRPVR